MNKKKINLLFICIIVLTSLACIIHTTIRFFQIKNNISTSAPASVSLLLLIPYSVAILIETIIWLAIKKNK